jgi:hypothetical protein
VRCMFHRCQAAQLRAPSYNIMGLGPSTTMLYDYAVLSLSLRSLAVISRECRNNILDKKSPAFTECTAVASVTHALTHVCTSLADGVLTTYLPPVAGLRPQRGSVGEFKQFSPAVFLHARLHYSLLFQNWCTETSFCSNQGLCPLCRASGSCCGSPFRHPSRCI